MSEAVTSLHWNRKAPCSDCPFLKSSPFHEGIASSLQGYGDALGAGTFIHSCHKTDKRMGCDHDADKYKGDKPQHCYGAIMMQLRSKGLPPLMALFEAADEKLLSIGLLFLARRAQKDSRFFTWKEMLGFYAKELEKVLNDED